MPRTRIDFGTSLCEAELVLNEESVEIGSPTNVINIGTEPMSIESDPVSHINPYRSTILTSATIGHVQEAIFIKMKEVPDDQLRGIVTKQEKWRHLRDLVPEYPLSTPLYISRQVSLGHFLAVPQDMVQGARRPSGEPRSQFEVKVNVWWCPPDTNCGIHTGHKFFEFHTQLLGVGHMRKYREQRPGTMYEDVVMAPGQSHASFCTVKDGWYYPWHAYVSKTDCIWMAIEYHKVE